MAKFSMECPQCGQYINVKTGLLAKRNIECSCGNVVHIKTDKYVSRQCQECGNTVLVDISKAMVVKCPVCRKKINRKSDNLAVQFPCGQCGVLLQTSRHIAKYSCPICDYENDVALQVRREQISLEGLASVIKYEGDNETLVWKHPIENFNLGTQLIVHESQEAIFFRDGQALDLFGSGRYTLESQQLPLLEGIYRLPKGTENTFHCEVYFINLTTHMSVKWGTDTKVRLFDPASGIHVELGASGDFNIRVTNSRKLLLKLVGTTEGLSQTDLLGNSMKGLFRTMVVTQVKSFLATTIREKAINILELDEHLMEISESLRVKINSVLLEYGLEMSEFFVGRIVTPDDDPNFRRLKEQYAEQYLGVRQEKIRKDIVEAEAQRKTAEAQIEAQMKIIDAQGEAEAIKIRAVAEAEAYKARAMVEAEEMHAKGYTYQQETARQVGTQAMQNGLIGHGEVNSGVGGGLLNGIGEVATLGMTLGAVGSMANMTREVLKPVMETTSQMGQAVGTTMVSENWNCTSCGQQAITTNFCPNCGTKRPIAYWNCSACGKQNITTNFCPDCGKGKEI